MKHPDMTIVVRTIDHIEEIRAFVRAHNIDPNRVLIPTTIKIENGQVTFEQIEQDASGKHVWDGDHVKVGTITKDLVAPWPLPIDRVEWGYGYVDTPGAVMGPMTEQTARRKVSEDLAAVLFHREAREGNVGTTTEWVEVDTAETPAVEVDA